MGKKITILLIIVVVIGSFFAYRFFFKKENGGFSLAEIKRGSVVQEVSETGQIQMGEEINLSFKGAGMVEAVYAKVGDEVSTGQSLAKIQTTQLGIELSEAEASLDIAKAKLSQLLAGSSVEKIQVAQTALDNAQIDLEAARQNLKDVEADAKEDLDQSYADALNILDGSYEKGVGALTTCNSIQRTYFTVNDQESLTVKDRRDGIESVLAVAKNYIDVAKADLADTGKIDTALLQLESALSHAYEYSSVIRNMAEASNYKDIITVTDKASLDTAKQNFNTGLTNVVNARQTIASTKLTNELNINTAKAEVFSSQGALRAAENDLALEKAGPRKEEVDLYEAQVKQAQAKVRLLENQIWESTLRSPSKGTITKVNKKVGEMVQSALADSVIVFLPANPYEIKTDIYEEDIVKMKVGNEVSISLVAFPDMIFKGKVVSINPSEKLIDDVVYYEITVDFDELPEAIKPGMTADLVIKTASKENVLVAPEEALEKKDGKYSAEVLKNNVPEEREVEIGLMGSDGMFEIVSGLNEGEFVIIK